MSNEEAELEDDVPALQDRVAGMVMGPLRMNDTTECAELDMKCMHDVLHELEGGAG